MQSRSNQLRALIHCTGMLSVLATGGHSKGQSPGECNCVSPGACLQNDLKLKPLLGEGGKLNKHAALQTHTAALSWHPFAGLAL